MLVAEAEVILRARNEEFKRNIREAVRESERSAREAGDAIEKGTGEGGRRGGKNAKDGINRGLREARTEAEREAYRIGEGIGEKIRTGLGRVSNTLTLGITLPVAAALRAAKTAASDFTESVNKVDVTFGEAASAVLRFGETSAQQFGISARAANDYASTFGGILKETKLTSPAIAAMSLRMTELTSDLASFKNLRVDEAFEKLKSGLVGETEPLRNVGVILNETKVAAEAAAMGFKGKAKEMSEAQKVMARYSLILKETKDAQGDTKRTADEAANSERRLAAVTEDLASNFGKELLPVYKEGLQIATKILTKFKEMSPEMRQQVIRWTMIAAGVGPVLKGLTGVLAVTRGIIGISGALTATQAAVAASNASVAASADAAAISLGRMRLAYLGLAALAAVPIIITVKTVYEYADAENDRLQSVEGDAKSGFGLKEYMKMMRDRGSKKTNTELIEDFKKTRWYKQSMDALPNRAANTKAYEDRERMRLAQEGLLEQGRNLMSQGGGLAGRIGGKGRGTSGKITKLPPIDPDGFRPVVIGAGDVAPKGIDELREKLESFRRTIQLWGDDSEEAATKYELLNMKVDGSPIKDLMAADVMQRLRKENADGKGWFEGLGRAFDQSPIFQEFSKAVGGARQVDTLKQAKEASEAQAEANKRLAETYEQGRLRIRAYINELRNEGVELTNIEKFKLSFANGEFKGAHWGEIVAGASLAKRKDGSDGALDSNIVERIRELTQASEAEGRSMQDILAEVMYTRQERMDQLGWLMDNRFNEFLDNTFADARNWKGNMLNLFKGLVDDIGQEFLRMQAMRFRNWALGQIFGSLSLAGGGGGGTGDGSSGSFGQTQVAMAPTIIQNFNGTMDAAQTRESAHQGAVRALDMARTAARRR